MVIENIILLMRERERERSQNSKIFFFHDEKKILKNLKSNCKLIPNHSSRIIHPKFKQKYFDKSDSNKKNQLN